MRRNPAPASRGWQRRIPTSQPAEWSRTLVEYPDRLKAAHVRHEDVDEHQVEAGLFQCTKPGFAAIGYRHVKALALKIDLDGRADHGIVINDKNACHVSPRNR